MKKFSIAALLTFTALASPVNAQSSLPTPSICVVSQASLEKSAALKSIVDQLQKKRAEIQKELAADEKKLKDEDKALAEQQKKLSEKEFAPKRQDFEKRVREVQTKLEIRRIQMEVAFEEAKKKVYDAFLKSSDQIKKELGCNLILYKETIVTADDSFDVSNKVLASLDKSLPTVTVVFKSDADIKKLIQQQGQQQ